MTLPEAMAILESVCVLSGRVTANFKITPRWSWALRHENGPAIRRLRAILEEANVIDLRASEALGYYASHGRITDPGPQAATFTGLPADIRALTRAVQGLVFHYFADEKVFGWRP